MPLPSQAAVRPAVTAAALVLAVAPFAFLGRLHDPANLPQSAFLQVAALALLAAVLSSRAPLGRTALDAPILGGAAWTAATVAWAPDTPLAVAAAAHAVATAAWFVVVSRSLAGGECARRLLAALFASGTATALLGLAQHLFGVTVFYQAVPPAATFVHKNIAAQLVAGTLPLAVALVDRRRPWTLFAGGAAAGLMAVFVGVTATRSAWLAVAVAAALMARARWGRDIRISALMLALVAGLGLAALAVPGLGARIEALRLPPPESGWQPAAPFTSVHHRQAIWLNTVEMIRRERPLSGVGAGNFAVRYPAWARTAALDRVMTAANQPDHAHNDYVQVVSETGLVGGGLLAWALVAAALAWRRGARDAVAIAVAGSAAAVLTDALVSFPLQRALPPFLLATLAGIIAARDPHRAAAGDAPSAPRPAWRWAALTAVVIALVAGAGWSLLRIRASAHVLAALGAERAGDWRRVRAHAEAALVRQPGEPHALVALARADLVAGRPRAASVLLGRVLAVQPHHLPSLGLLAMAEVRAGEPLVALGTLSRLLALDPGDARAHFQRAEILEALGARWPALHEFRVAVAHDRLDARYQYRRARAAARVHSIPEAVTALHAALALSPHLADAHKLLGVLLHDVLGRRAEGRHHLAEALRLRPDDPDAERMRAIVERRDRE